MDTFAQKHIFGLSTVMCGDKIKLQIAQVKNILRRSQIHKNQKKRLFGMELI